MTEPTSRAAAERARILAAYERRKMRVRAGDVDPLRYTVHTPGYLFATQLVQRRLIGLLHREGFRDLAEADILDVGAGDGVIGESEGMHLLGFLELGADPRRLHGIELQEEEVERGRRLLPAIDLIHGSADALPWDDASFDIVCQSTVFSSILDDEMRAAVAREMRRVVRRDGLIVWYDFRRNNPRNPDIRRVTRTELGSLFPDCSIQCASMTLAHPIARLLAPRSWALTAALAHLRMLQTHDLAAIRPRGG